MRRCVALLLLSLVLLTPSQADVLTDAAGLNSGRLMDAAQDALRTQPVDWVHAGSLGELALLRYRIDSACFTPTDDNYNTKAFQYNETELAEQLKPALLKGAVLKAVAATLSAWDPAVPAGYNPGWHVKSRCADYASLAAEMKRGTLRMLEPLLALYQQPGYEQAYTTFSGVLQAYLQAPPEDAYSPARLQAFDAARDAMVAIERRQNMPYAGVVSAGMEPLGFKVLVSSHADARVDFTAAGPGSGPQLIYDAATLQRLWRTLDSGLVPVPLPQVDFSHQMVVFVQGGPQDSHLAAFINRIELVGQANPVLMVYLRTPVGIAPYCKAPDGATPYVVAVLDKPAHLPATAGFDLQNFPVWTCQDVLLPWPPHWQSVFDLKGPPQSEVYRGGGSDQPYDGVKRSFAGGDFWGKYEFKEPQPLGDKTYTTELIQVRVDCTKLQFSRLRDMKLDAAGVVLADDTQATAFQPFPEAGDVGDMPRDAGVAEAEEDVCATGD